jgi:oligogalacturonide transporter
MLAGMPYENLWGNNNIGFLNRNKPAPGKLPAPSLISPSLNPTLNRNKS